MCVELGGDACLEHRGTPAELKPGEWHLLTVVHDNPTVKYYIDKTPVTKQYPGTWASNPANPVGIGYQSQFNARWYDGFLDEARVIKAVKDENWIKLNYESQREGSKLVSIQPATTGAHKVAGLAAGKPARIARYDLSGRKVAEADAEAARMSLSRGLRPGLYVDRWYSEKGDLLRSARTLID
jgi:hypothetical protein